MASTIRHGRQRLFIPPSWRRALIGVGVVAVGSPIAVMMAERPTFAQFVGLPFLVVIVVATLLGRLSVGLLSVAVSAVLLHRWVVPELHPSGVPTTLPIVIFAAVSVGIALVLSRLERETGQRLTANARLRLITRVGDTLASSLDHRVTMQELADLLVPDVGDMCVVHTVAGLPVSGSVAAAARDPRTLEIYRELSRRYPGWGADTVVERVMREGRMELLTKVTESMLSRGARDRAHLDLLHRLGVRSAIVAPMTARGTTFGTLSLSRIQTPQPYSGADADFVDEIADRVAVALANTQLYMEAQAARARVSLVSRVSELLAREIHYPAAFHRLADLLTSSLTDLVLIDALTPDGGIERVVARHADPAKQPLADILGTDYAPSADGEHPVARVIRGKAPEFSPEMTPEFLRRTTRDDAHLRLVTELGFRSFMCVPLETRGRILGTLTMVSTDPARIYGADDLEVGMEIGRRAAVRIDHARLYEEQRNIARTLQLNLLPRRLPPIPGAFVGVRYWAAGEGVEVGGDFYDVLDNGNGRWLLSIGDVSGKGAPAAALIGLVRHTARALASRPMRPGTLLRNLNTTLLESTDESEFCTMCVAQIRHIDDGPGDQVSLTLATGGHPPPYLVRADGSITRAELKGTPLGLLADIQIGEYTATMGPADTLVMYTDGLSERPNGEPAHTRDMEALLKGAHEKSVEELLLKVEEEIEPGSLLDDAALLVFRVAG